MSSSSTPSKKTVYVDVDEEITGIIDKVKTTNESIIALVLPKRATVLQSIVNMKLLKRAADQVDKKVVLITSEHNLMPLAGVAGLHVANSLQSRPYVPSTPETPVPSEKANSADESAVAIDPETPIGDLAKPEKDSPVQPIEIDNRTLSTAAAPALDKAVKDKKNKPTKDKSKKIPDFNKFRLLIIGGLVLLLLLIGFGYWALAIAPKATITVRTESSETPATAKFTADTNTESIDLEQKILPAQNRDLKKNETEKVQATGEKDNGTKAVGQISLRNCSDDETTVPAGTGISNGNFTFITQNTVNLNDDKRVNGACVDSGSSTKVVSVIAKENGEQYNLSPRSYTVAGYAGIVATGEQMSGGSSKKSKVIAAADVDAAKKKISDKQNAVVEELKKDLHDDGYVGVVDTFNTGTPIFNVSPAIGTEANEVTVTAEVTYSMFGLKQDDLKKIIVDQAKDSIDTSKQTVLDYGLDEASYEVGKKTSTTTALTLKTTLVAGAEIDQGSLKKELAGKNSSDAQSYLKNRPGVTDATVTFKPFWVSKVPNKDSKVTLIVEQANGKQITP